MPTKTMTAKQQPKRKPVPDNKLKVSISISPAMLAKVDQRAEELEFSRSAVIGMALRKFLK